MAIAIYDKDQNRRLFEITEEQLGSLIEALEEEFDGDSDYYIDAAVCDFLEGKVDAVVLERLRAALPDGGRTGGAGGEALEAAGEDEEPPEFDDEEAGIEIIWRRE